MLAGIAEWTVSNAIILLSGFHNFEGGGGKKKDSSKDEEQRGDANGSRGSEDTASR